MRIVLCLLTSVCALGEHPLLHESPSHCLQSSTQESWTPLSWAGRNWGSTYNLFPLPRLWREPSGAHGQNSKDSCSGETLMLIKNQSQTKVDLTYQYVSWDEMKEYFMKNHRLWKLIWWAEFSIFFKWKNIIKQKMLKYKVDGICFMNFIKNVCVFVRQNIFSMATIRNV